MSVAAIAAAANLIALAYVGVFVRGDAARYLDGASRMLAGQHLVEKQASYIGYISLIAGIQSLGGGVMAVVIMQILIAAAAGAATYEIGTRLGGRLAGVIAGLLFVLNPDIARWNLYILTDSLYISALVFATLALMLVWDRPSPSRFVAAAGLALVAALLRPNGWIFVVGLPMVVILRLRIPRAAKALAVAGVFVAAVASSVLVSAFRSGIEAETPGVWLRRGVVVWGYDGWRVPMPASSNDAGDWVATGGYALSHPLSSARLALTRVAAELGHARPFYSTRHNAGVVILLAFLYAAAIVGIARTRRDPPARIALAIIVAHLGVVAITFADWDGRFLAYVLPLIGCFAGVGISRYWSSVERLDGVTVGSAGGVIA